MARPKFAMTGGGAGGMMGAMGGGAMGGKLAGAPPTQLLLIELKHRVLGALHKLADRDTQQIAVEDLERIVQSLSPEGISLCLNCLYDTDAQQKSVVRRECVKLFGTMASVHGDLLVPHLPRIVANITRRLKDPDSNIRDACVEAMGTLAGQVPGVGGENGQNASVTVFVKPLFEAMTEQNRSLQAGAAMCLARVIESAREIPPTTMQRLCPRIAKFSSSPNFLAKAALLAAIGSLFQASGSAATQYLPTLIPCAHEALESTDWATRKAAADTLSRLASALGPNLSTYKTNSITALEGCRFDKVKPVRDSVADALQLWKSIPDGDVDTPVPTPTLSVSKEVASSTASATQGRRESLTSSTKTLDQLSASRVSGIGVANPASGNGTDTKLGGSLGTGSRSKRRTPALSDRKLNPDFFRKIEQQKLDKGTDDWEIEVAIPKGGLSPSISPVQGLEEDAYERQEGKLRIRTSQELLGNGLSARSYDSPVHNSESGRPTSVRVTGNDNAERGEYNWRRDELIGVNNSGLRIRTVGNAFEEKSPSPDLDGSSPWLEPNPLDRDMDRDMNSPWDVADPATSPSSSASYDVDGQGISSADEWNAIQKQLHRLEFQQSNLFEMFQEFMGSVHESMLGFDARIRGLERVAHDSASDVPASIGRLGNGISSGFEGVPGRSLSKFLASSQSLSLKLRKAANASRAAFSERLAGCEGLPSNVRGRRDSSWENADTGSEVWDNSVYSSTLVSGSTGIGSGGRKLRSQRFAMGSSSGFGSKGTRADPEGEQVGNRKVWDRGSTPKSYGEGLCVRSVWQAAKDEATLEAIRGAGEDGRGHALEVEKPSGAGARLSTLETGGKVKETFWMLWSRAMDYIRSGDMDSAYVEVMSSGDELLLIRLMSHTGPVLTKLASATALEMVQSATQLLQQQSFLDSVLPWIHQIADLVSNNGPECLGLSSEGKKELVTCLQESSAMEFPEDWMAGSVADVAQQLCTAWSVFQKGICSP